MTLYHITYKDLKTNKIYKSYVRAENIKEGVKVLRESAPNKIHTIGYRKV